MLKDIHGCGFEPFLSLLGEIECGDSFSMEESEQVAWRKKKLAAHLGVRNALLRALCADRGGAGTVGVKIEPRLFTSSGAEVIDIGVVKSHRRQGLGSQMLAFGVKLAEEAGAEVLFVKTYVADTDAVAFYGRNGFCPVAVIP